MAAVSAGVAALVSINSFSANLQGSVQRAGARPARRRPRPGQRQRVLAARGGAPGRAAHARGRGTRRRARGALRGHGLRAAHGRLAPGAGDRRASRGYPFYGAIDHRPARRVGGAARGRRRARGPVAADRARRARGRHPGPGRGAAAHPRHRPGRARRRGLALRHGPARLHGARATSPTPACWSSASRARYEAYVQVPPAAAGRKRSPTATASSCRPSASACARSPTTSESMGESLGRARAATSGCSPWSPCCSAASAWPAPCTC